MNGQDLRFVREGAVFEFKRLTESNEVSREESITRLLDEAAAQMLSKNYKLLGGIGTVSELYAVAIDAVNFRIAKVA